MFAHVAKGVILTASGLGRRTNNQVVAVVFEIHDVLKLTLFQELRGDTDAARIPVLNESGFHQQSPIRLITCNITTRFDGRCQLILSPRVPSASWCYIFWPAVNACSAWKKSK